MVRLLQQHGPVELGAIVRVQADHSAAIAGLQAAVGTLSTQLGSVHELVRQLAADRVGVESSASVEVRTSAETSRGAPPQQGPAVSKVLCETV